MDFFNGLNNQNNKVDKIPQLVVVYTDKEAEKIALALIGKMCHKYNNLVNDSVAWDTKHYLANKSSFSYKNKIIMIGYDKIVIDFIADPTLKSIYSKYGVDIRVQGNHCSICTSDIKTTLCEELAAIMIKDGGCNENITKKLRFNLEKLDFYKSVGIGAGVGVAAGGAAGVKMMKSGDFKNKAAGVVCAGVGVLVGGAGGAIFGMAKFQMDKAKVKRDIQYWHSIDVLLEKYMADLLRYKPSSASQESK